MATIIRETRSADTGSNGMGFLLGIILLIVFAFLFFYYGLPMITNSMSTPSVSVPEQVDVNVNTPNK